MNYRNQDEAGLPPGPIDDDSRNWQDYLAIGIAWGLLMGLAAIDYCESFLRMCHG